MPWARSLAWCWFRRTICAERLLTRQRLTSHPPPAIALKLRRFAAMGCTATAVIPMKSAIPAIPKKSCSGAISPSMACCSIHSTIMRCSILSAGAPISTPASSAPSASRRSVSPKINCGCCEQCASPRALVMPSRRRPCEPFRSWPRRFRWSAASGYAMRL